MAITVPTTGTTISSSTFGVPVANALNTINLADTTSATTVTLSTTSSFAMIPSATVTLSVQTRIRIKVQTVVTMASGTSGHYLVRAGYNTGAAVSLGSFAGVGNLAHLTLTVTGGNGAGSVYTEGSALLAAGQYTFYGIVQRSANGSATDTAGAFYLSVVTEGFN